MFRIADLPPWDCLDTWDRIEDVTTVNLTSRNS